MLPSTITVGTWGTSLQGLVAQQLAGPAGDVSVARSIDRFVSRLQRSFMGRRGRWHLVGPEGRTIDVKIRQRQYSDNLLVVRTAALEGAGMAPLAQCRSELEAGRLRVVLPGWAPPSLTMYAVYPSRRASSTAGACFINDVVTQLGNVV